MVYGKTGTAKTKGVNMLYGTSKHAAISFPLGGIGAGCIGLAGNGSLIDWEVFNHPDKTRMNGISHFALRAEKDGKVLDFRLLNGDWPPPYMGQPTQAAGFHGMGWGLEEEHCAAWPHFRKNTFQGTFPTAKLRFSDEAFPGNPVLTAWSVLIPGNSLDSSLPAAFLEITVENTMDFSIDYTVAGVLANPWARKNVSRYNYLADEKLTVYSGDGTGELTLTLCEAENCRVSGQTNSYRGVWRDPYESYLNDMMAGGLLRERCYKEAPSRPMREFGVLAAHFSLEKKEKKSVVFAITWHIPSCSNTWDKDVEERTEQNGVANHWKTYYATVWKDSRNSGEYARRNCKRLRKETFIFRDSLFQSSLPKPVLDGVSANLSVLKSPTCLRLEDGTFWGWEGVGTSWGSCPGSCTHVWNYAQALPFLFPDLERSMRESHLRYGIDERGGHHFRLRLPLGIRAKTSDFRPCADGQFGEIMKFYRDWKICGDNSFLARWWPDLRRMMEYAWSPDNPDQWDPRQSGILEGRQHHTLDMELFGPNLWLTGHYLGALKASAEMADAQKDFVFSEKCRRIFSRGRDWVESNLFNGEYFYQKINLHDRFILEKFDGAADVYWNFETGEIKYQIGEGCAIDTPLAQWYADLYGLGELYSSAMNRSTLSAIFRHNYKKSLRNELNVWRTYALNDESGTLVCTWPKGKKRPKIPLTYNSECMTGFEWAFAGHLVAAGLLKEGETVAKAIRDRFDGCRRNPWNEFECGSNYARSMASYGMLLAYSGFCYDSSVGMIGFFPKTVPFSTFWSLGDFWGIFKQAGKEAEIIVRHGNFLLKELRLNQTPETITCRGDRVELPLKLKKGDRIKIRFASDNNQKIND